MGDDACGWARRVPASASVFVAREMAWMAGSSPTMTEEGAALNPFRLILRGRLRRRLRMRIEGGAGAMDPGFRRGDGGDVRLRRESCAGSPITRCRFAARGRG
jgi:hypothetical protein